MRYLSTIIIGLIIFLFIRLSPVRGEDNVSYSSAQLLNTKTQTATDKDERITAVRNFLKRYNSALEPYSELIVKKADEHGIDWTLAVSISGVESTFCKRIPYNSFNCWGWENGQSYFKGYTEALEIVSKSLGRYYRKGLNTPEKIGPVYAPPSKTWAKNVRFFMNKLKADYSPVLSFITLNI